MGVSGNFLNITHSHFDRNFVLKFLMFKRHAMKLAWRFRLRMVTNISVETKRTKQNLKIWMQVVR